MREELHHLIEQLPEEQVAPILASVRESLPVGGGRGDTVAASLVCGDAGQREG